MRIDTGKEHASAGSRPVRGYPGPHLEPAGWSMPDAPRTLIPRRSWSTLWYSIVALVAVLPGLHGLRFWDLVPPGPWWGLRGLAVLEGHWFDQASLTGLGPPAEVRAYRHVAMQPPLYAWLQAAALSLSGDREPIATVVPSYLAGVLVVILVYRHGKLWGGRRLGALAAILMGFNRHLLSQMQQASPTTLGLALALASLLAYAIALRNPRRPMRLICCVVGGLALGLSLLSVSLFAISLVPLIALHQAATGVETPRRRAGRRWIGTRWLARRVLAGVAVLASLGIALALAMPWHLTMYQRHGATFVDSMLEPPISPSTLPVEFPARLLMLAPLTILLALHEAARAVRRLITTEPGDADLQRTGGALWVAWAAVAALMPTVFPAGPRPTFLLFLLVPLNLLAARSLLNLADRAIPVRRLLWLAPGTIVVLAWAGSPGLRTSLDALARGAPLASRQLSAVAAIVIGLAALFALVLRIDRWARRDDQRRRLTIGSFLGVVIGLTIITGVREVQFRHRETLDLLDLREAILRRHDLRKLTVLAVLAPEADLPVLHEAHGAQMVRDARRTGTQRPREERSGDASGAVRLSSIGTRPPNALPGGRLRFVLRSALPHLAQIDLTHEDDLANLPEGQRLVVLAGSDRHLSYALQARLQLESLEPGGSGLLDAYATPIDPPKPRRIRR